MPEFSPNYARGLTRKATERLDRACAELLEATDKAEGDLLGIDDRHPRGTLRGKRLAKYRQSVAAAVERSEAGMGLRSRRGANGMYLSYGFVEPSKTQVWTGEGDESFVENAFGVVRVAAVADEKRFRRLMWKTPVNVGEHAIRRYVQRDAKEAVDANAVKEFLAVAERYALPLLRAHSLGEAPPFCVAPVGDRGVLLGHVTNERDPFSGHELKKGKSAIEGRTISEGPPAFGVSWRTFVTRDMLGRRQTATLRRLESAYEEVLRDLEADERIAHRWPFPEEVPESLQRDAVATSRRLLEAVRETGMEGFHTLAPGGTAWKDEKTGEIVPGLCETEREATRRMLWSGGVRFELSLSGCEGAVIAAP